MADQEPQNDFYTRELAGEILNVLFIEVACEIPQLESRAGEESPAIVTPEQMNPAVWLACQVLSHRPDYIGYYDGAEGVSDYHLFYSPRKQN